MSTNIQVLPGKVGISNTNPTHTLDIGSNVYVDDTGTNVLTVNGQVNASNILVDHEINIGALKITATRGLQSDENFNVSSNLEVGTANLFVDTTTGRVTMNEAKVSSNLEVGTANLFVDTLTGRVGIGVTDPGSTLDVSGDVEISSNLEVGTANLFVDTTTGRVGIGVTDPSDSILDVAGTLRVGSGTVGLINLGREGTVDTRRTGFIYHNGSDLKIANQEDGELKFTTNNGEKMSIKSSGNVAVDGSTLFVNAVGNKVGIGTTNPEALLHLSSATGSASIVPTKLKIHTTTYASTGWDTLNPWGLIEFDTDDASYAGSGPVVGIGVRTEDTYGGNHSLCFYTDNNDDINTALGSANERMCIDHDGNVGIGTTNPDAILDVRSTTTIPRLRGDAGRSLYMGNDYTHVNSTGFAETSGSYAWDGYPGVVRVGGNGEWRVHGSTGSYTVLVRADGGFIPFTGLHETYLPFDEDDQGKIVYSTGNYASELKDGNVDGVICDYLTVLDACPVVKICVTENDKRVMGVLSTRHQRTEIKEITEEEYKLITGNERYGYEKKEGSNVYVRDIDTDEFSRGYYNAVGEGSIWVCNKNGNFENGDYITSSTVAGYGQKQNDDLLHNYTVAKITTDCDFSEIWVTTKKHKKTRQGYLFDENKEPVYENILDAEGNTRTHLKFKIRYLLSDGTQISKEEYTTRVLADEEVYKAAFVGCTYHCG